MKVSIVTVAYNAATTIVDTVRSVDAQTYPEIEYIVIDGASTDNTVALVRESSRRVSRIVSEADSGIYDAMNKGLAVATGDYIAFLNSDDWYSTPESVAVAAAAFGKDVDLVYGDLDFVSFDPPHKVRRIWRDTTRSRIAFNLGWHPAHPSTFMRTSVLRDIGGFDPRFGTAADYAMFCRYFLTKRSRFVHVPAVLASMRLGGASTSGISSIIKANRHCLAALKEFGAPVPWATTALKVFRKALQLRAAPQL